MNDFLDWFRLEEAFSIIALACILSFVGGQMTRRNSETYRRAQWISAAVFLLYAGAGIHFWGIEEPTEVALIVIRASLAAGTAFGVALVTLSPVAFLIERVRASIPKQQPMPVEAPKPQPPPPAMIRDYAAEERTENERMSKIDDARKMTEQFYAEHAEVLAESLPQALFATQMQTRFPDGTTADQAWNAAQGLITEMVPLIKAGRDKKRADDEERKRAEEAVSRERQPEDSRTELQRITDWYQREKDVLLSLPESDERENFLNQLEEQCDRKIKNALAGAKP